MTQSPHAAAAVPGTPPPGRYGGQRTARRPLVVALVAALAAALAAWAVWAALGASGPGASGQVRSFDVRGPHQTRVEIGVDAPDPGRVTCRVQALDGTRAVVGVTTARVRVGASRHAVTEVTVRTRATAVTAVVDGCAQAGSS